MEHREKITLLGLLSIMCKVRLYKSHHAFNEIERIIFRIEMTQLSLKQEVQIFSSERVEILNPYKLAFDTNSV